MAISYPLTPPSTPGFVAVKCTSGSIIGMTFGFFDKAQEVQDWGDEPLTFEVTLRPYMNRAQASDWIAFLQGLRGRYGTCLFGDPSGTTPRGQGTGTPQVNGAHNGGARTLATKGWTPNITGILKRADYIQIGQRLHRVIGTDDVNSDAVGNASIEIGPQLRAAVTDSASITVNNAKGLFRLTENTTTWDLNNLLRFGLNFKLMEAY